MKRTLPLAILILLAFAAAATAQIVVQPVPPVQPAPAPVPLLPDLQVGGLSISSPAVLHCGTQNVTFTATDVNAGNAPAGRHYLDLMLSTGAGFHPICRRLVAGLNPGASNTVTFVCSFWNGPCDCLPSTYTATFQAFTDSLNQVAESNESNNLSNTVSIPAACP